MAKSVLKHLIVLAAALLILTQPARAQQPPDPKAAFDAKRYTAEELRFLQAALTQAGTYTSLYDGLWGARSQKALETYAQDKHDRAPRHADAGRLANRFDRRLRKSGWEMRYFRELGMSALFPAESAQKLPQDGLISGWQDKQSSVKLRIARLGPFALPLAHQTVLTQNTATTKPYTLRRSDRWVTTFATREGNTGYIRSDLINGGWSSVYVTADADDTDLLRVLTGSITRGKARALSLPETGALRALVDHVRGDKPIVPPAPTAKQFVGNATLISPEGHFLAYGPALAECDAIFVAGRPAKLLQSSDQFGLALLAATPGQNRRPHTLAAWPSLRGEGVLAAYIRKGQGRQPQLQEARIRRSTGPDRDEARMFLDTQLDAGANGAAVVNQAGALVGILVPHAAAMDLDQPTGKGRMAGADHMISSQVAALFLARAGVLGTANNTQDPLPSAILSNAAVDPVVKLTCTAK